MRVGLGRQRKRGEGRAGDRRGGDLGVARWAAAARALAGWRLPRWLGRLAWLARGVFPFLFFELERRENI